MKDEVNNKASIAEYCDCPYRWKRRPAWAFRYVWRGMMISDHRNAVYWEDPKGEQPMKINTLTSLFFSLLYTLLFLSLLNRHGSPWVINVVYLGYQAEQKRIGVLCRKANGGHSVSGSTTTIRIYCLHGRQVKMPSKLPFPLKIYKQQICSILELDYAFISYYKNIIIHVNVFYLIVIVVKSTNWNFCSVSWAQLRNLFILFHWPIVGFIPSVPNYKVPDFP